MGHGHDHAAGATGGRLRAALLVTLLFTAGEAAAGFWTGSLALISDAAHNLADGLALGLAWWAHAQSSRRADARRTFGYHRVGVLAAVVNALALVLIAGGILWEAWHRWQHPAPVPGLTIMAVAAVALAVNALVSWWLHHGAKDDVNLRGAYLHMVADAAASAGVLIAGGVILATGWTAADALASALIGVLILWSSWGVLAESVGILLESAPARIDTAAVSAAVRTVPGVLAVHDLHAWTLGTGLNACSVHVVVAEQPASAGEAIARAVADALRALGIAHTTVQVEVTACVDGCAADGEAAAARAHGHDHGHGHHDHDHDHDHAHGAHGH